jgi:hypothetical protein
VTTTVDTLRTVCGLIDYRSLPAPVLYSVHPGHAELHLAGYGDLLRWAAEFHTNPHETTLRNGDTAWTVDVDTDGLHLHLTGYEHHQAVA